MTDGTHTETVVETEQAYDKNGQPIEGHHHHHHHHHHGGQSKTQEVKVEQHEHHHHSHQHAAQSLSAVAERKAGAKEVVNIEEHEHHHHEPF